MIGNKIEDKITGHKSWTNPETSSQIEEKLIEIPKKGYNTLEKRQEIIDELRSI